MRKLDPKTQPRGDMLPVYRVRACNMAAESENRIHDDRVASQFGFRGGLVPGIAVYAYMTVPIVERFGRAWLEQGSIQVKFHQPFYEGEMVIIRARIDADPQPVKIAVAAEREDGTVCATALATVEDGARAGGEPRVEYYPEAALPHAAGRPEPSRDLLASGSVIGTVVERLSLPDTSLLASLDERSPLYRGPDAVAHPYSLLGLANQALMRNYRLGPWIHTASDVINWGAARDGEEISVRGRILESFERKGHEFVELDLLLVADRARPVQQVRHTAIYRLRQPSQVE